jgi:hypothetical protein
MVIVPIAIGTNPNFKIINISYVKKHYHHFTQEHDPE